MGKYKNSKFKVSFVDFISLIILMLLSFISGFYTKNVMEYFFNDSNIQQDYMHYLFDNENFSEFCKESFYDTFLW